MEVRESTIYALCNHWSIEVRKSTMYALCTHCSMEVRKPMQTLKYESDRISYVESIELLIYGKEWTLYVCSMESMEVSETPMHGQWNHWPIEMMEYAMYFKRNHISLEAREPPGLWNYWSIEVRNPPLHAPWNHLKTRKLLCLVYKIIDLRKWVNLPAAMFPLGASFQAFKEIDPPLWNKPHALPRS